MLQTRQGIARHTKVNVEITTTPNFRQQAIFILVVLLLQSHRRAVKQSCQSNPSLDACSPPDLQAAGLQTESFCPPVEVIENQTNSLLRARPPSPQVPTAPQTSQSCWPPVSSSERGQDSVGTCPQFPAPSKLFVKGPLLHRQMFTNPVEILAATEQGARTGPEQALR